MPLIIQTESDVMFQEAVAKVFNLNSCQFSQLVRFYI